MANPDDERTIIESQRGGAPFVPPEPAALAPDFPELEITELIGAGGMGAVYKARQPKLDRFVALKILPDEVADDPASMARFEREARAMAALSHPNIIPIYDFGAREGQGYAYFIMEFVDGMPLDQEIAQNGALGVKRSVDLLGQICDGLGYAHEQGVIHRDIKAANILIDGSGRVRIVDFGLAKRQEDATALTLRSTAMGTPLYMSPEQMRDSGSVDHRADVYALGILFHQMLTGSAPQGVWTPASQKNPEIDKRFDEVVHRAMQEDPDQRFSSTAELREAVEAILEPKKPSRGKGLAVGLGLVAVAVLVAVALIAKLKDDPDPPADPAPVAGDPPEAAQPFPLAPERHPGTLVFAKFDSMPPSWFPELTAAAPDDLTYVSVARIPTGSVEFVHADGRASKISADQPDVIAPVTNIDGPVHQIEKGFGAAQWHRDGHVTVTGDRWGKKPDSGERFTHFSAGNGFLIGRLDNHAPRFFVRDHLASDSHRQAIKSSLPTTLPGLVKLDAGGFLALALIDDGTVLGFAELDHLLPPKDLKDVRDIAVSNAKAVAVLADGRVRSWGGERFSDEVQTALDALRDADLALSGSAGSGHIAIRHGAEKSWLIFNAEKPSEAIIERGTAETLRGCDFVALGLNFAAGIRTAPVPTLDKTAALVPPPHEHALGTPFFVRYDSQEPSWFPEVKDAMPDDVIQFTIPPHSPGSVCLVHADGRVSEISSETPESIALVPGIDAPVHEVLDAFGRLFWLRDGRVTSSSPGWGHLENQDEQFSHFAAGSVFYVGRTKAGDPRVFIRDLPSFDQTTREGIADLLPSPMPELAKLDAGARKILGLRPDGSLLYSATVTHAGRTPPADLGKVGDIAVAANLCLAVTEDGRARIWGIIRINEKFRTEIAALRDVDKVVSASAGSGRMAIRHGSDKQWLVISQAGESDWRIDREAGKALRGCDFVALGQEFAGGIREPAKQTLLPPPHEHAPGEPFFVRYDSREPAWLPDLKGTVPGDVIQFTIPPSHLPSSVCLVHTDGRVSEIHSEQPEMIASVEGIDTPVHEVFDAYGRLFWMRDGSVACTSVGYEELQKNSERFTQLATGSVYYLGRTQNGDRRIFFRDLPSFDPTSRAGLADLLPSPLPELAKLDAGANVILGLRPDGELLFSAPPGNESRAPPADLGKVKDIAVANHLCVAVTEDGRVRTWSMPVKRENRAEIAALRGVDKVVSASAGWSRVGIRHGPDNQWLILSQDKGDLEWRVERETGKALRGCEFVALGAEFAGGLRAPTKEPEPAEQTLLPPPHEHARGTPFFVRYDSTTAPWFPELEGAVPDDVTHITVPAHPSAVAVTLVHTDGYASEIRPEEPNTIAPIRAINDPIHQSVDSYGTVFWLRDGRVTSLTSEWDFLADNDERFTHFAAGNNICVGRASDGAARLFVSKSTLIDPEERAAVGSMLPETFPELAKLVAGNISILALRPDGTLLFSGRPGDKFRAPPKDLGTVSDIAVAGNLSVAVLERGRARVWGAVIDAENVAKIDALRGVDKLVSSSAGATRFAIRHGADKQWLILSKRGPEDWVVEPKTGEALRGCDFIALGNGFAAGIRPAGSD